MFGRPTNKVVLLPLEYSAEAPVDEKTILAGHPGGGRRMKCDVFKRYSVPVLLVAWTVPRTLPPAVSSAFLTSLPVAVEEISAVSTSIVPPSASAITLSVKVPPPTLERFTS